MSALLDDDGRVRLLDDVNGGRAVGKGGQDREHELHYVTPRCPTFDDEPCYVIVDSGLNVEVGP